MRTKEKNICQIIQDDGLINDYEFEAGIYMAGLIDDFQNYLSNQGLIYSGVN